MNLDPQPQETDDSPSRPGDDTTGLPGLQTWRGVYLFVFGMFVVYVVLLTILSRVFA